MNNIKTHRVGIYFNVDKPSVDYMEEYGSLVFQFTQRIINTSNINLWTARIKNVIIYD